MIVDLEEVAREIRWPSDQWLNNCHAVSLQAVRFGLFGEPGPRCRVTRGITLGYGINGQHSWIALGDPYDPATEMVDLTAHCWGETLGAVNMTVHEAYEGATRRTRGHIPHGYQPGSIWEYGRPAPVGDLVELEPSGLSDEARSFLDVLGPLSVEAWAKLLVYPHQGWPAREICTAIVERFPRVRVLAPIDVRGNATDTNPEGLYW